eukprot:10714654-Ditylum_brightwellii.AAC.1
MVYYSPMIDEILNLSEQLNLNIYCRVVLMYMTILSEFADIFVNLSRSIQKDKSLMKGDNIGDIAWALYKEVWKMKDHNAIEILKTCLYADQYSKTYSHY